MSPKERLNQVFQHLWRSPAKPQRFNKPHLHDLSPTYFLPRAAAIEPNAEAIVHVTSNGHRIERNYAEWSARTVALAHYFLSLSPRPARVGILLTNTPSFLELMFAIPAAGAVQASANYRLKKDDVQYILQHAEVDIIFVDREFVGLLDGFVGHNGKKVKIIVDEDRWDDVSRGLVGEYEECIKLGEKENLRSGNTGWETLGHEEVAEDDLLALAYTSGTTSRPKGVEYTHRGTYLAALGNVIDSNLNSPLSVAGEPRTTYLWTLPMFHATGWTFPWAITLVRGTHVCLRKIDYPLIWKFILEENVTHFNAAPTVNTLLLNDPIAEEVRKAGGIDGGKRLVKVTVAASPPTAELFKRMIEVGLIPVHVYGLTESYGPFTKGYYLPEWAKLPKDELFAKLARQGHNFSTSRAVRVVKFKEDEDDSSIPSDGMVDVAKDGKEIGEIVLQGNIVAKGYHKDPEATAKAFQHGYFHTGDLAVWHPDGAIKILDRAKDIIISGGENISSIAVEGMLAKHPDVLEAAIVATKHDKWGETPYAFVTVKNNKKIKGEDIIQWAKEKSDISRFMVPGGVEIVEELPKTSTGKLRKNVLREWVKGGDRSSD